MAKKIKLESFKYHFLRSLEKKKIPDRELLENFTSTLEFLLVSGQVKVQWRLPVAGEEIFDLKNFRFYVKGDTETSIRKQSNMGMLFSDDNVSRINETKFQNAVTQVLTKAGLNTMNIESSDRLEKEEKFHDEWANNQDIQFVDVRNINEACTAPEMRYIHKKLGNINGKELLDVGCGLGEASVYFALQGANVTATDLSKGMLDVTRALGKRHKVAVKTHKASAEGLDLPEGTEFDIIYTGNLLHHVDIEKTLIEIKRYLKPGGTLVTWDPLKYNPVINVYRAKAKDVRTPDEHPLTWNDLKLFERHFEYVERKYFWLSTLLLFIIMALIQRRNPNKERFWKVVIDEADKWYPLYMPLELLDRVILKVMPPLRLLCWNVVIFSKK